MAENLGDLEFHLRGNLSKFKQDIRDAESEYNAAKTRMENAAVNLRATTAQTSGAAGGGPRITGTSNGDVSLGSPEYLTRTRRATSAVREHFATVERESRRTATAVAGHMSDALQKAATNPIVRQMYFGNTSRYGSIIAQKLGVSPEQLAVAMGGGSGRAMTPAAVPAVPQSAPAVESDTPIAGGTGRAGVLGGSRSSALGRMGLLGRLTGRAMPWMMALHTFGEMGSQANESEDLSLSSRMATGDASSRNLRQSINAWRQGFHINSLGQPTFDNPGAILRALPFGTSVDNFAQNVAGAAGRGPKAEERMLAEHEFQKQLRLIERSTGFQIGGVRAQSQLVGNRDLDAVAKIESGVRLDEKSLRVVEFQTALEKAGIPLDRVTHLTENFANQLGHLQAAEDKEVQRRNAFAGEQARAGLGIARLRAGNDLAGASIAELQMQQAAEMQQPMTVAQKVYTQARHAVELLHLQDTIAANSGFQVHQQQLEMRATAFDAGYRLEGGQWVDDGNNFNTRQGQRDRIAAKYLAAQRAVKFMPLTAEAKAMLSDSLGRQSEYEIKGLDKRFNQQMGLMGDSIEGETIVQQLRNRGFGRSAAIEGIRNQLAANVNGINTGDPDQNAAMQKRFAKLAAAQLEGITEGIERNGKAFQFNPFAQSMDRFNNPDTEYLRRANELQTQINETLKGGIKVTIGTAPVK